MNSLYPPLSILLSLLLCVSLSAQTRSNLISDNTPANPSAYSYNAPSSQSDELSKKELRSFQRSLARRADDLADWDLELENREIALSSRNRGTSRQLNRNPLPPRLLSQEELFAWETRLDQLAKRLVNKEASVRLRESRVNFDYEDHDDYNQAHRNERKDKKRSCKEKCCKSKDKEKA